MGGRRGLIGVVAGLTIVTAISTSAPAAHGEVNAESSAAGEPGQRRGFEIELLSSPAEYISGGDARIAIHVPPGVDMSDIGIRIEDRNVTGNFAPVDDDTLEGVVTGLALGRNRMTVRELVPRPRYGRERGVLVNHPLTGPMFSGQQQTPFLCASAGHRANAALGPAIDADCSTDRVVSFMYRNTAGSFAAYDPEDPRPADMSTTTTMDGATVDYIVRWERGTINRFIYSIAVLSPLSQDVAEPDLSAWNDRLLYHFEGGVAIGRYQGNPSRSRMLYQDALALGYAVAYSTGTKTGTHYNLVLGGETAIMVKDRFVTAYGDPDYTVGVGGSGGAIQQYVYAQNHPGLIDAGIPQYSYPDMVTQTIHVGDCELLERWIDTRILAGDAKWLDWTNRTRLEGMNARNGFPNDYAAVTPFLPPGSSECINGWRGLSPLALNPHYGTAPGVTAAQQASTDWTHYADAVNVYGVAADGFAASTWDNVGVQYGLEALTSGFLSTTEFLDLNAQVGSWKNEPDMVQEGCPFIAQLCPDPADLPGLPPVPDIWPNRIDVWSWRNMALSLDGGVTPAPRRQADPGAIANAYHHGHVNTGDIEIPLIDWRNYLERELDMHNSHQSFAARRRLLDHDDDASNQVIWFTDGNDSGDEFDQTPMALEVIDEWMRNIEAEPALGVAGNRPATAVDSCFDATGALIHAGTDAWTGVLDDGAPGPCTTRFPVYSTSRIVAGGPITGDVFKCHLQPLPNAIAGGVYGGATFTAAEITRLQSIFPDGVCDYTKGDAARP